MGTSVYIVTNDFVSGDRYMGYPITFAEPCTFRFMNGLKTIETKISIIV